MNERPPLSFILNALIFLFLLSLFLLVLKYLATSYKREASYVVEETASAPTLTPTSGGSFVIKPAEGLTIYPQGSEFALFVFADSSGASVVAYDVVLGFDDEVLTFAVAESLERDFQIVPTVQDGTLVVTGSRLLESKTSGVLQGSPVLSLTFKVSGVGSTGLEAIFVPGATDESNIMDTESRDVLGSVVLPEIFVGARLSLVQGVETVLENEAVRLTLVESIVSSEGCFDCMDSAKISLLTEHGDKHILEFTSGGIAGLSELSEDIDGRRVQMEQIGEGEVVVRVARVQ